VRTRVFLAISFLLFSSSCIFGPSRSNGIKYARHGKIYISHNSFYTVGTLDDTWKPFETRERVVAYYNKHLDTTLYTDAFCSTSFDDLNHQQLITQKIEGLEDIVVISERTFSLDNRLAASRTVNARIDGVAVTIENVVVKKNVCLFDFVLISTPASFKEAQSSFQSFYEGFHF